MNVAVVAIGSNLPVRGTGGPIDVADAAVSALDQAGIRVLRRSRWYWSEPVPAAVQPLFVNGVAVVHTALEPVPLLRQLLAIELRFGRVRTAANQSRTLDLDLLTYGECSISVIDPHLIVPHPRLHHRAFVLQPLHDTWPAWRHPTLGLPAGQLLQRLGGDQWLQPIGPWRGER